MDKSIKITNTVKKKQQQQYIDMLEVFELFKSKLLFVIIAAIIGGGIAGAVTYFLIEPKYSSTSELYIVSASSDSVVNLSDLQIGTNIAPDYTHLIMTRSMSEMVIQSLSLPYTSTELRRMISVANPTGTRIITITVTTTDPQESATIANEIAKIGVVWLPKVMNSNAPNIFEDAIPAKAPSSPSLKKNIAIGAMFLAMAYFGIELIRYYTYNTINTPEQIEAMFGTIPLAVVPEDKSINYKDED